MKVSRLPSGNQDLRTEARHAGNGRIARLTGASDRLSTNAGLGPRGGAALEALGDRLRRVETSRTRLANARELLGECILRIIRWPAGVLLVA